MTPVKSQVLPFESIEFVFTVRNETERVKKRVAGSWSPSVFYPVERDWFNDPQGIEADGIKWKGYKPDLEAFEQPPFSIPSFAPGEVRTWVKVLEYEKQEHKLARPGRYVFKGAIVRGLESNKVEIIVKEPNEVDKAAYEYLQQQPLHYFFHEQTIAKYSYGQATVEAMERFITRFQASQYAEIAKLGLALMWKRGVEGKKDLEQARSLLQEVVKSSDEARAARAYYYLGQLAEEQGELMDAHQYYGYALSLKVDPYIEYVAKEAQTKLEPRLSPPKQKLPRR
jgi:tetratricopeptide (TPR) repeat protein